MYLSTTFYQFVSKDFTHLLSQAYPNWLIIRFVYVVLSVRFGVERGDQEGTVSPNWLSTLELWRHLYTGKEKSFVRKDLPTNFKSHFQGFECNDEETF